MKMLWLIAGVIGLLVMVACSVWVLLWLVELSLVAYYAEWPRFYRPRLIIGKLMLHPAGWLEIGNATSITWQDGKGMFGRVLFVFWWKNFDWNNHIDDDE